MRVSDWLENNPGASFESWKEESRVKVSELGSMSKEEVHQFRLMEKYGNIWRDRVKKGELLRACGNRIYSDMCHSSCL